MISLLEVTQQLAEELQAQHKTVVTAESCTGGGIAHAFTELSGSSAWFERGYVTYSNEAKMQDISVPASTIEQYGAVSEQTVEAMVAGALNKSRADVAVAVSGVAGPSGGSEDKPVGTVWFAWGDAEQIQSKKCLFDGNRQYVREQAVAFAIQHLLDWLQASKQDE